MLRSSKSMGKEGHWYMLTFFEGSNDIFVPHVIHKIKPS